MSRKRHGASKKAARKPATSATTELQRLARMGRTHIPFPIPGVTYYENHVAPSQAIAQEGNGKNFYNPLISLQDSVEATRLRKLAKKDGRKSP